MPFLVQRQPLSAKRLCCSLKSSQEQNVLSNPQSRPRTAGASPAERLCPSGGTEPPAAVPMSRYAAKSAQIHKGATYSRKHPLRVPVILSKFTFEPRGHCRLPLSPLKNAVQTPSSFLLGEGIYIKANTEEHTSLFVHGDHQLERSQAITEP